MRLIRFSLIAALLACGSPQLGLTDGVPGDFDFYVLALSWSPTYCLNSERPDARQCGSEPYGFIVHGLWPQYDAGYPDYCETSTDNRPSAEIVDSVLDIMPSPDLVDYQWQKHGTCAGLPPRAYFKLLRNAYEKIQIPSDFSAGRASLGPMAIERAFLSINPNLPAGGIAVICSRGALAEVRICLTKDLDFRTCNEVDRDSCRAQAISVPAER